VTTEDDFQKALDAQPDDWQTRLVFADWLDERGDPRAEGYRALGALRRVPFDGDPYASSRVSSRRPDGWESGWSFWGGSFDYIRGAKPSTLPWEWRSLLPSNGDGHDSGTWAKTRREAEDVAAIAFSRLPAERRAELLSVPALT
jgi:uncharacterized protein (TIGR02996 family)